MEKVALMTLSVTKVRYVCYIRKLKSGNDLLPYIPMTFFFLSFQIKSKCYISPYNRILVFNKLVCEFFPI